MISNSVGAEVVRSISTVSEIPLTYVTRMFIAVLLHYVCIAVLHALVAGLLARSQYPERPTTGHLDTDFSWFPCV